LFHSVNATVRECSEQDLIDCITSKKSGFSFSKIGRPHKWLKPCAYWRPNRSCRPASRSRHHHRLIGRDKQSVLRTWNPALSAPPGRLPIPAVQAKYVTNFPDQPLLKPPYRFLPSHRAKRHISWDVISFRQRNQAPASTIRTWSFARILAFRISEPDG